MRCVAGGGGGAAAAEVKGVEQFADENDYIKAGGSEIVYVEMQGTKAMEMQDKISDKVIYYYYYYYYCSIAAGMW